MLFCTFEYHYAAVKVVTQLYRYSDYPLRISMSSVLVEKNTHPPASITAMITLYLGLLIKVQSVLRASRFVIDGSLALHQRRPMKTEQSLL